VVALYRAADVMVVTPLRDGLNLVAKEFCASRTDEGGVLVLSEFAGAAAELGEAIRINPYDLDQFADAFKRAIDMSPEERRSRMQALRQRVLKHNVHEWCRSFLKALVATGCGQQPRRPTLLWGDALERVLADLRSAPELHVLLDYDGTLVPFASRPELAAPDPQLYTLLEAISRRPNTAAYLLSGRRRDDLERWFSGLPMGLVAEHGYWVRRPGDDWTPLSDLDTSWKGQVRQIMANFTERTPGSFVETKTPSLAWHYRNADVDFSLFQEHELRAHLVETLANLPVQVLQGDKVLEVRLQGVDKGTAVSRILGERFEGRILALGDDCTDEDMFAALPSTAYSIHVGYRTTRASYRLPSWREARALLERLL
ncbi:MAG: trehalose-phosphatase, partial [Planctomycetes bacterium]|nr:trehalose-phosphatase [Planctomycetota bacterium]